jgi:hypothetical protein
VGKCQVQSHRGEESIEVGISFHWKDDIVRMEKVRLKAQYKGPCLFLEESLDITSRDKE